MIRPALRAYPGHLTQAIGLLLDDVEHGFAEGADELFRVDRPDAADHARAEIFLDALDCGRRRSLEERGFELDAVRTVVGPGALACTNSPADIIAAWPTRVMRSRWPRALTRRTQKPFSELWNVTRSTNPARTSIELAVDVRAIPGMMKRKIRGRYSHRAGSLALGGFTKAGRAIPLLNSSE